MSKPMSRENPAARPVSAMPTTPAAGPDRIASLPRNNSAAVRPPDDIMNMRRVRFTVDAHPGCFAQPTLPLQGRVDLRSPATCDT